MNWDKDNKTHFGFAQVSFAEKAKRVANVFHSVADNYNLMNDLMSLGIHRFWKRFTVEIAGIRQGQSILDLASGTGDLALRMAPLVGQHGVVVVTDINESMLALARQRLVDAGVVRNIRYAQVNAEQLPFADHFFDRVTISFGLRNVVHKELALQSIYRVLKPGGRLVILEFSRPVAVLQPLYDIYSFKVLPLLGRCVAGDAESYRYLAESIRVHPDQESLRQMLLDAGFENCDFYNLSAGIVAIHRGFKS
jgi:demethylmenaquinone methyltransferase / 2-methoxy-6-polyprenyl-1,4-benzoquinol methylase